MLHHFNFNALDIQPSIYLFLAIYGEWVYCIVILQEILHLYQYSNILLIILVVPYHTCLLVKAGQSLTMTNILFMAGMQSRYGSKNVFAIIIFFKFSNNILDLKNWKLFKLDARFLFVNLENTLRKDCESCVHRGQALILFLKVWTFSSISFLNTFDEGYLNAAKKIFYNLHTFI